MSLQDDIFDVANALIPSPERAVAFDRIMDHLSETERELEIAQQYLKAIKKGLQAAHQLLSDSQ